MSEWNGELKLVAIDGDRVVFLRNPVDEMHLSLGARYAVAIVEIDDQENLAPQEPERKTVKRTIRNPSNTAAILAKDPRFQSYAAIQMLHRGSGNLPANEQTATEYIRRATGVTSRADLDINPAALEIFHQIELEFYRTIR